jgi:plastocyanin
VDRSSATSRRLGRGTGADTTFTSASTPPRGTFSHRFHGIGAYNYSCTIHGFAAMHGTITVTSPK